MRRELNLYFASLSGWEALLLIVGGLRAFAVGNQGVNFWASRLESGWRHRFGGEDALVFPSGRAGLYALLRAMGVGSGDEVIVTGFTCAAVPVPVLACGAIPVYADIDPQTYSMDPEHVARLLDGKTRALIIQHTFGIPAELPKLLELAQARSVPVIEDACLALGSRTHGRPLGSFGAASIFSFELSKTLSAGWGGLVQTNVPGLRDAVQSVRKAAGVLSRWEAARRLLQPGLSFFLYHPTVFALTKYFLAGLFKLGPFRYSTPPEETNGRLLPDSLASPHDVHWRVIASQLGRLESILDHSSRVASRYRDVLRTHGWANGILEDGNAAVRLIRFPLLVREPERMVHYFARESIELGRWFDYPISPAPNDLSVFRYRPGQCPVAERVSRHVVNLPLHRRLSPGDVDHICRVLDDYLSRYPEDAVFGERLISEVATVRV